jgi:hypothetical protein
LSQFNRLQQEYIRWLATSKYDRIPSTQEKFAETINRNRKTLQRWQKLPGWWDAVIAESRYRLRTNIPEVYESVAREAEKGSYQHAKLALELTGEYVEKRKTELSGKVQTEDVTQMSDEELDAIAEA